MVWALSAHNISVLTGMTVSVMLTQGLDHWPYLCWNISLILVSLMFPGDLSSFGIAAVHRAAKHGEEEKLTSLDKVCIPCRHNLVTG